MVTGHCCTAQWEGIQEVSEVLGSSRGGNWDLGAGSWRNYIQHKSHWSWTLPRRPALQLEPPG